MATTERRIRPEKVRIERRKADDNQGGDVAEIVGHAAVYDQWTTLYEGIYWTWREIIRPGAFERALKEKQDVRCLFNHDPNFILGRTKSGTCQLSSDKVGLLQRTQAADSQTVRDLVLTPIDRGDIDGMSFGFCLGAPGEVRQTQATDGTLVIETDCERVTIRREGERTIEEREILDCDLYDVSPVVYPAYTGTDVALRSMLGVDVEARAKQLDRPRPEGRKNWLMLAAMRLRLAEAE